MTVFKKYSNAVKRNKWEVGAFILVLIIAAILTLIRPFNPDTVSYFSDITTPMVLLVGIVMIILVGKRVV
jgi:hypothetical protein